MIKHALTLSLVVPILPLALLVSGCGPDRGAAYERSLAEARRAHHAGLFVAAADRYDEAAKNAKVARDAVFARYEAALARARAGDVARAARELRAIADASPPNDYSAEAAFKAADLAGKSDPVAGAAELEAMALRFPKTGVAKVALARVLRQDASDADALARLEHLAPRLAGTPLEEDVLYERGKRLAATDKTPAARDAFLEVASRWPYPHGAYFDDALFRASECEEKLGRIPEAIAHLERMLSFRETSTMIGSYQRPRYTPALLRIADLREKQGDRARAREALHRLYADFKTSTSRDDALWREAELWRRDGDGDTACSRLATLADDFPDSRYVPCAIERCPGIKRGKKSRAPLSCRAYLTREGTNEERTD